jgi:dTDP-4-amino-4,6-dideoxygalactose transaminase
VTTWKVPLADVRLGPEEEAAVAEVLRSGWLSQGPKVEQFEGEFARFLNVKHALAVASGTAALHLACLAIGLGPGDEVLCPALTFVATANAILYTGARPRFVDIKGPDDLNLSPEDAARKITPQTRAIMVVHYGGFPADMTAFLELAHHHHLALIEDCAHAPGAMYAPPFSHHKVGALGALACFSFFANKNMTTGEGGLVVTNDPKLAAQVRLARSHGMTTLTWDRHQGHSFSYDVQTPGYNYRLDEIRAALGLVQLARLEELNACRRELTRLYRQQLQELPQLALPFCRQELSASACHLFPVVLAPGVDRLKFMHFLKDRGIQTSVHYLPVHQFSYYQGLWPQDYDHQLPVTEDVAAREVTLPLFPAMTEENVEEVVRGVKGFLQRFAVSILREESKFEK